MQRSGRGIAPNLASVRLTNPMSNRMMPDDAELGAICVCVTQLSKLGWTAQWRVLNYLVLRFLGNAWALGVPKQ